MLPLPVRKERERASRMTQIELSFSSFTKASSVSMGFVLYGAEVVARVRIDPSSNHGSALLAESRVDFTGGSRETMVHKARDNSARWPPMTPNERLIIDRNGHAESSLPSSQSRYLWDYRICLALTFAVNSCPQCIPRKRAVRVASQL